MPPTLQLVRNLVPSGAPATLRVLLTGTDALSRARLWSILAPYDELHVAESHAHPDAIVVDLRGAAELPQNAVPFLVLVRDGDEASEAISRGARGVLLQTAEPRRIRAALHAVAEGLTVVDDDFADAIVRHQRASVDLIEPLTAREREVLHLVTGGMTNKEIAARLGISDHTVKFHVNGILGKLGVDSRTEAVVQAARLGIVTL